MQIHLVHIISRVSYIIFTDTITLSVNSQLTFGLKFNVEIVYQSPSHMNHSYNCHGHIGRKIGENDLEPVLFLAERRRLVDIPSWLDICCGQGCQQGYTEEVRQFLTYRRSSETAVSVLSNSIDTVFQRSD